MSATAPTLSRHALPPAPSTAPATTGDENRACDVCPHPVVDHDAIGLRFCRATRDAGTDRGCACR
jgi:hypothetical protein